MATSTQPVRVPPEAVSGDDILVPAQALLRGLSRLGDDDESAAAGMVSAAFGGPDAESHACSTNAYITPMADLPVQNVLKLGRDEKGWSTLALRTDDAGSTRYLVAKGTTHEWVDANNIKI